MKLYKYRSLTNFEQILDIALKERLYCSTYNNLNDPFEGLFRAKLGISLLNIHAIVPPFGLGFVHKSVEELSTKIPRICSLSSSLNDVRLWSNYADGHRGIVFEIDFSDLESYVHEVKYSEVLPPFLAGTLLTEPLPSDVLSCKTKHWEYEAEYRIFNDSDFFDISNRLTAIYFGSRIDESQYDLLIRTLPNEIPKFRTKINMSKVIVEPITEAD